MADYRIGLWKTVIVAGVLGSWGLAILTWLVVLFVRSEGWPLGRWLAWTGGMAVAAGTVVWMGFVLAGGLVALHRDSLERRGLPYADRRPREWVAGPRVLALWRAIRWARSTTFGTSDRLDLRPGELVEVKSLEEILATLDDRGMLDEMPFMPEMTMYCGRKRKVFRRVDKLNDWVHKTGLRRVHRTVLLEHTRCDGGAHGGCQANCHLRWKESWLQRVSDRQAAVPPAGRPASAAVPPGRLAETDLQHLAMRLEDSGERRYMCQTTELNGGTSALAWSDPWHYLRDLCRGNVRPAPFLVGVSLLCFNWIQAKRGGVTCPVYIPAAPGTTPQVNLGLRPGELVRVKGKRQIESTLNSQNRNRGLWFDGEMLRFCGGEYRVQRRVERLLLERTGKLIELSNPCVILEGVTATGEYRAFNPENESILWREIWLERVQANPSSQLVEAREEGKDDLRAASTT